MNVAKIDRLERLIKLRKEEKAKTEEEIQNVDDTMAGLTSVREDENRAFLEAKAEDQDAIDLLIQARQALSSYYTNHSIDLGPIQGSVKALAFAQQPPDFDVSADSAPDTVFSGQGKRKKEAKGIVQILTTIIEDLNDEIKNGMKAEEEAQIEYEGQMKAARKLRQELVEKRDSLQTAIAKRGEEKNFEEIDMATNKDDLADEQNYKASITDDCDFIIRTFEKRAASRAAEMQGLVGAEEYLAGATTQGEAALLEKKRPTATFDDRALSRTHFLGIGS